MIKYLQYLLLNYRESEIMKYIFEKELHYNREYLGLNFEEKYKMLNNIFNETVLSKDDKFDWLKGIDDTLELEIWLMEILGFKVDLEQKLVKKKQ